MTRRDNCLNCQHMTWLGDPQERRPGHPAAIGRCNLKRADTHYKPLVSASTWCQRHSPKQKEGGE